LAVLRVFFLMVATRASLLTLATALEDSQSDAGAAALAAARLPQLALRTTALGTLVTCAVVGILDPAEAPVVCPTLVSLGLLAAVLHRFIVGGPLLDRARRLLAMRPGGAVSAPPASIGGKLVWAICTPTVATAVVLTVVRTLEPSAMAAVAGGAAATAFALALLAARDMGRSAERVATAAELLAAGESGELAWAAGGDDEHARAGAALLRVADRLARSNNGADDTLGAVGRHVDAVAGGAADAAAAVRAGAGGLETVLTAAAELDRLAHEPAGDLERLAAAIRKLSDTATRALSSDGASVGDSETLRRAADTSSGAAHELNQGIGHVAQGIQVLMQSSVDTANSTSAMDDAVARVRLTANDTVELSARVSAEAERGYRAVHKTLDEIERIRDLVEQARRTIDDLGSRLSGIGQVVLVIEEIAQKTNLLALNASIIAAQAGQHGRGFAVVASEIKALAQRTATSTKEIAGQIAGIQTEAGRAMTAMANGVEAVNQGFQVAVGAGDALGEIRQSARAAQKKVQGIARSMEEQSGASRRVAESTNQLAMLSQQVTAAIREHSLSAQRIHTSAQEMSEVAQRVDERLRRSGASTTDLEVASAEVTQVTRDFARLQKERLRAAERVQNAIAAVREAEALATEHVRLVSQAATLLRDETAQLKARLS
jgi:methyl-accepting chemotaxis protein